MATKVFGLRADPRDIEKLKQLARETASKTGKDVSAWDLVRRAIRSLVTGKEAKCS